MNFGIVEFPGLKADESIVRSIDNTHSLIYIHDVNLNQGVFILYEHVLKSAQYFYFEKNYQVKDMEIKGDIVYFCGNESSYRAFVGQFNIKYCFAGTDVVNYCLVPPSVAPFMVTMNTATRMTTMTYGRDEYILAIGDGTHNYTEPIPYVASTLFSTYLSPIPPTGYWYFNIDYQKAHQYHFTDIDCLDNHVAYTGTDVNGYAFFFLGDKQPIFFYSSLYTHSFALGSQVENHQLLLKARTGDRFTIAYLPLGGNWVDFVDVTVPIPTTLSRYSTQPSVSTPYVPNHWKINDLRHNDVTDNPLLLGQLALPPYDVFSSWVAEFDWGGTTYAQMNTASKKNFSLDGVLGTTNYVVTDNAPAPFSLGVESFSLPSSNNCFFAKPVTVTRTSFSPGFDNTNYDPSNSGIQSEIFNPIVKSINLSVICY